MTPRVLGCLVVVITACATSTPPARTDTPRKQTSTTGKPLAKTWDGLLVEGGTRQLQEALATRGFYDAPADGAFGPRSQEALRTFQESQRLPATGIPDHATARALGLDPDALFRKNE